MEIKNVQVMKPFGPLVMTAQLPKDIVKKLNNIVDRNRTDSGMGKRLVGQIKKETEIPHHMLEEYDVMNVFHAFSKSFVEQGLLLSGKKYLLDLVDIETQMQSIWSVAQYENEYNPLHSHTHCQISGVLYLKVPNMKPRNIPDKGEMDGKIEFNFCNDYDILVNGSFVVQPKPGLILLFPNGLNHTVYPFLGNGERRSIAFNMAYKNFKKDTKIQISSDSVNMYNQINHMNSKSWGDIIK